MSVNRSIICTLSSSIARIAIDDGRRNVMSAQLLTQIHDALGQAEAEARAVFLTGRPGIFSAGFDLQVFARRDPSEIHTMMRAGAELALRLFTFPLPVVVACTGHAFPMGAFLLLASDVRLGAKGVYQIGLNEVPLGITVPHFAVELCRSRMPANHFYRIPVGEMVAPDEAVGAGFLDRVVGEGDLEAEAIKTAEALSKLDTEAYRATKSRVRGEAAKRIRQAIDEEITVEHYRRLASARGARA